MSTGSPVPVPVARPGAPAPAPDARSAVVTVTPGQVLAARILAVEAGRVELAVAGGRMVAESQLPLTPGESVRLTVAESDDQRIVLRLTPDATPGLPARAAAAPGLPPAAGAVLADALGARAMPAESWRALVSRAVAAGVQTPMQAAAFVRLEMAGLPATAVTVGGLADVADGPPLGRLLTLVTGGPPSPAAPAPPAGQGQVPAPAPPPSAAPDGPEAAPAAPRAGTPPTTSAVPGTTSAASAPQAGGTPVPASPAATPAATPAPAPATPAAPTQALQQVAQLVAGLAADAVSGDPERVRRAAQALGQAPDGPARQGAAEATLRAALLDAAAAPDTPPTTARLAERAADAIGAQALVPPAAAQATDPTALGAYLQMPLPGGQTAEVRVLPDGGREGGEAGEGGVTRVAFLLHLSALGPVVVEAVVSAAGVDATVRSQAASARAFLTERAAELAEGLARVRPDGRAPRVAVERMTGPPPRALPPPPSPGLDASA